MPDGMRTYSLALCMIVAGCHFGGGSGSGGANNTFYFANCGVDCSLTQHTVAAGGAHTTVDVNGTFSSVSTSDPSIAVATKNGTSIEIISGNPGTTTLSIYDAGHRVIASSPLTVEATATLKAKLATPSPIVLEGQPIVFHVTTLNARGEVTKGSGAVAFTLGGTLMPDIVPVDGDAIGFVGAAGNGTISASCPSASLTQTFTIVPQSAISALDMSSTTQPNEQAIISVVPRSSAGGVYAGPCHWTTSDPSVTLASDIGPSLDLGPGTLSVFNLRRPGTFTVTCSLAGLTSSVTLTR